MRSFLLCFILIPSLLFGQDSLFTASQVPGSYFNEPDKPVELGTRFNVNSSGVLTAIKWFSSVGGTYTANLYKGTDKIYSTPFQANARGWVTIPITVFIEAGEYTASVFASNGRYGSRNNVFPSHITKGELSTSAGAGRFSYSSTSSYPTDVYRNSSYYVDIVFVKAENIWTKVASDTVILSLDTCGQTPSAKYLLQANGPDNLSYTWTEIGNSDFNETGKNVQITLTHDGQRMFSCEGKDDAGNIRSTATILVNVEGNPNDVIIELLRNGSYRVKGNNLIFKNPYPILTNF